MHLLVVILFISESGIQILLVEIPIQNVCLLNIAHVCRSLEGGIEKVGNQWFECGWISVIDSNGKQVPLLHSSMMLH